MTENEIEVGKSRTQIKREFQALHDLARQLVALPAGSLEKLPVTESLSTAVSQAKTFSRGALARQLRYIAGLLPHENVDAIHVALDERLRPHREQTRLFHEAEFWRDSLISGNQTLFNELVARFPDIDRQHLHQLVRNAQKEYTQNPVTGSRKAARVLFQYLIQLQSSQSFGAEI